LALASLVALTSLPRFAEACLRHPFFVLLRDSRLVTRLSMPCPRPERLASGRRERASVARTMIVQAGQALTATRPRPAAQRPRFSRHALPLVPTGPEHD
ncbi:MAG: hypothetical protein VB141_06175, partial [Burkholderia gladioli]